MYIWKQGRSKYTVFNFLTNWSFDKLDLKFVATLKNNKYDQLSTDWRSTSCLQTGLHAYPLIFIIHLECKTVPH